MSAVTAAFLLAIFCFAGQARSAQSAAASIGEVVDPLPHIVFVVGEWPGMIHAVVIHC